MNRAIAKGILDLWAEFVGGEWYHLSCAGLKNGYYLETIESRDSYKTMEEAAQACIETVIEQLNRIKEEA